MTPDPGGTLDGVADCGEDVCQHLPTCEEVSELMAHPDPGGMVGAYAADDALVATQRACTCPKWDEAGFPSRTCPAHAGRWLA